MLGRAEPSPHTPPLPPPSFSNNTLPERRERPHSPATMGPAGRRGWWAVTSNMGEVPLSSPWHGRRVKKLSGTRLLASKAPPVFVRLAFLLQAEKHRWSMLFFSSLYLFLHRAISHLSLLPGHHLPKRKAINHHVPGGTPQAEPLALRHPDYSADPAARQEPPAVVDDVRQDADAHRYVRAGQRTRRDLGWVTGTCFGRCR